MKKPLGLFLLFSLITLLVSGPCSHPRPSDQARILYEEGQGLLSKGRPDAALKRFEASLALSREQDDARGTAHNLNEIGIIHTQKRSFAEARTCFQEAETLYRRLDMAGEISKTLNNRAITFILEKRYGEAASVYHDLLEWDERSGNRLGLAITHTNLGHLYETFLNQPAEAIAAYEKACGLLNELGDRARAGEVRARMERLQTPGGHPPSPHSLEEAPAQ